MQQFIPFSPYMTAQQRLYQMEQQYPQLAQPQPQPQQQSNNFLMAIPVTNIDEANAFRVDPQGTPTLFYNAGKNEVYLKRTNMQTGLAEIVRGDNGKITSFAPKLPFRAADYNDKPTISGWSMPSNKYIDLTLGASGSTYTVPANGWLQCACTGTAGSTFFELTNLYISCCASFNGGWGRASMPVSKEMVITVYYGGNNFTKQLFRFTYAEGSK